MLSWEAAREKVLAGVIPLKPVTVPVEASLGLSVAQTVMAEVSMPPFDNSAMDGFALQAKSVSGASRENPVSLPVMGFRPAGPTKTLEVVEGEAVRIMTGAPIPPGADAVVMVESTSAWDASARRALPRAPGSDETVEIYQEVTPGTNVRRLGESVPGGSTVLEPGHRIRGAEIGLLISVGVTQVTVHPRPVVAVLSTGDELVAPGKDLGPGEIPDSNRPALLATLMDHGFDTLDLGLAGDDPDQLSARILEGAREADFLITSGGVSVGDLDLTRQVLDRVGEVDSYRVAVKPGKPQLFGHVNGTPVFGLPGNPVSSLVVFDVFVLPALRKLAGRSILFQPHFIARLAAPLSRRGGRVEFIRVQLSIQDGVWTARSTGPQGSGVLSSMTHAGGYAILPESMEQLDTGAAVTCVLRTRD